MKESQLKILFTGDYLPNYNRTQIIRTGLQKLGHTVTEFPFQNKNRKIRIKLQELASHHDFVFMPSFTHQQVRYVRQSVGKDKFILFDPLISRYLTKVFDYEMVSRWGLSALRNFYRDKWSMEAANFVLTDTKGHLEYFHKTFRIPREKMGVLYIGNNFDDYFPPPSPPKNSNQFHVGFYGGFIPLQGVMNILRTAEILKSHPEIHFELIGTGFEYEKAKQFVHEAGLQNVTLPGWIEHPDLRHRIQKFDLALGIFGDTQKSNLVIPNKLYHYGACARAILTKDSPAIRELFNPDEDLVLLSSDPHDIAAHILRLKDDPQLREKLGQSIWQKLRSDFNEVSVATRFIEFYKAQTQSSL